MNNMASRRLQIISGRAHPDLAKQIASILNVPLNKIQLNTFANGEVQCHLDESVRDNDVFIIQAHGGDDINQAIMEQAIIIDAAKRASARSITAVCPYLGYARQDKKTSGREPITARLVVDILAAAGADRIMSIDLHAGQIQGFFDGPFDHIIARPVFIEHLKKNFNTDELVIVSPDAGRVKSAERYSSQLGCGMAIIHKHRSTEVRNQAEARYLIGDVKDRVCLIVDDMVDTAGTLCSAADLLADNGAKEVYGVATHGILSDPAVERIEASAFKQVIFSDTVPLPKKKSGKLVQLSIAPLIAEAIDAVFTGQSLSALFDGKNQF